MSFTDMMDVLDESPARGDALVLHMAIADTADDNGVSRVSMSKMMRWTRATEDEVLDLLGVLESQGEIVVTGQTKLGYVCLMPRIGARLEHPARPADPRAGADAARRRLIARLGERCQNCGAEGPVQAHHVVPVKNGGSNDESNLRLLCRPCHLAEHGRAARS